MTENNDSCLFCFVKCCCDCVLYMFCWYCCEHCFCEKETSENAREPCAEITMEPNVLTSTTSEIMFSRITHFQIVGTLFDIFM